VISSGAEAESKLARAARSARRLAHLSQMPRGAETLDLFAEDTERVLFQATNTDPRQGTLAGFELPDAFMASVCATSGIDDSVSAARPARGSPELDREAPVQIDLPVDEGAVGDLPVRRDAPSETAAAEPVQGDADPSSNLAVPDPARSDVAAKLWTTGAPTSDASTSADALDRATDATGPRPAQTASASVKNVARNVAMPKSAAVSHAGSKSPQSQPSSLAAAQVGTERSNAASNDATPELDRARATAFADTIDALYAVIAEQRQGAARLLRRMNTLLAFIGCVLAVTMAAGIAQTVALRRMNRENTLQQQRIEELLLDQHATLASVFDTDSANVAVPNAPAAPRVAASNAIEATGSTSKKHTARHAGKLH
jgi:hypothetical protein